MKFILDDRTFSVQWRYYDTTFSEEIDWYGKKATVSYNTRATDCTIWRICESTPRVAVVIGTVICRAQDKFSKDDGKWKAFSAAMYKFSYDLELPKVQHKAVAKLSKMQREAMWNLFERLENMRIEIRALTDEIRNMPIVDRPDYIKERDVLITTYVAATREVVKIG